MGEVPPRLLLKVLDKARAVVETDGRTWTVDHGSGFEHNVPCPAHNDHRPSASIGWSAEKRQVLLRCHAACSQDEVRAALGFTWGQLKESTERKVDATYDYTDRDDQHAFQVVRYDPKDFRQRRRNPEWRPGRAGVKRWLWDVKSLPEFRSVPYQLPRLLAALTAGEDVYIVEGEKDVDVLMQAVGAVASCNAGGAGKWTEEHSAWFEGSTSRVIVVADRDTAGYRHAASVADSLERGMGRRPEIVAAAGGKDASDHISHYGLDDFEPVPADVLAEALAKAAPVASEESASARPVLTPASAYKSRRQEFFWEGRVPLGTMTLMSGRGGVGKSTFALWMIAQAQAAQLPGDLGDEPVKVLYVSVEDDWATQVKPRLEAVGANLDNVYNLQIGTTEGENGERNPNLPEEVPQIAAAVRESGAHIVIFDPIASVVEGDDHKREFVRAVTDPLNRMAAETGCAVVGIMHFRKGGGNASDAMSGSHAWRDAARSVLLFARDDDRDVVVVSQDKGNYSATSAVSMEYRLLDSLVPLDDGEVGHYPRVEMLGESATSVQDLINREPAPTEATEWLQGFMRDYPEGLPAADGIAAADANGFTKDQMFRARKVLEITSEKRGIAIGWWWVPKSAPAREGMRSSRSSPDAGQEPAFFGERDGEEREPSSGPKNAPSLRKNANNSSVIDEEREEGAASRERAEEHVIKRRPRPNKRSGEPTDG